MKKLVMTGLALGLSTSVARADMATPPAAACGPDALGTGRTLTIGTQGGLEVGLESYPRSLVLADHEVVLTFDDGPTKTTPEVLDALSHECVKATFFLIGRNAEARPDLVKREIADGHTVGHHTFSHPARTLRRMSFEAAQADIERGFKADDIAACGSASDAPRVPFFRFPGFADTKPIDDWLASRNIAVFGTDLWAYDWLELSPDQELGILMRKLDKMKRGIILLHDTRRSTARMLPDLLRALKAGGYKIVRLVPGAGATATTPAPPGWSSETDKVIAEVFAHESRRHVARLERRFAVAHRYVPIDARHAWIHPMRERRFAKRPTMRTRIAWRHRSSYRRF